jgi:hypothetical protein
MGVKLDPSTESLKKINTFNKTRTYKQLNEAVKDRFIIFGTGPNDQP